MSKVVVRGVALLIPPKLAMDYIGGRGRSREAAHLLGQAAAQAMGPSASDLFQALLKQREVQTPDAKFVIEDRYIKFPLVFKTIRSGTGDTGRLLKWR